MARPSQKMIGVSSDPLLERASAGNMMKPTTKTLGGSERTKAQLIEENQMLWNAIDAMSDGIIAFDAEDRVVAFNAKHLELFPSRALGTTSKPTGAI